jgi:hypothetical protein
MPTSKKVFSPPRLHVYGDIAKITQAVGGNGMGDGSGGGATLKTAP